VENENPFSLFEQCGHVPEIEKPAEFNQALLQFFGK
jgi:pimeloyl-ACP methyl ester carboxylesterase